MSKIPTAPYDIIVDKFLWLLDPECGQNLEDWPIEQMEEIANSRHCFLVDLPTRGWKAGGAEPIFVSDYKRRYFRASAGGTEAFQMGSLWSRHLYDMMREIAFFRVFCEPIIHRILTRVLTGEQVANALLQAIPILQKKA